MMSHDCPKCAHRCRLEWRKAGWNCGVGNEGLYAICLECGFTRQVPALDESQR